MSLMRRACDQAKRIVLFFRRYAIQPSPRKPKIIISHVEDSGLPLPDGAVSYEAA